MNKRLFFKATVAKTGKRLIVTVPVAFHHLFLAGTDVKVYKDD